MISLEQAKRAVARVYDQDVQEIDVIEAINETDEVVRVGEIPGLVFDALQLVVDSENGVGAGTYSVVAENDIYKPYCLVGFKDLERFKVKELKEIQVLLGVEKYALLFNETQNDRAVELVNERRIARGVKNKTLNVWGEKLDENGDAVNVSYTNEEDRRAHTETARISWAKYARARGIERGE